MSKIAPPPARLPKVCLHRPTGRAYVSLSGTIFYLGKFTDPAAHAKGHRLIAEWLANGRRLRAPVEAVTVVEVVTAYLAHCREYYAPRPGATKSTIDSVRLALATIVELYGTTPAATFGPMALRAVLNQWVVSGLRRTSCNKRLGDAKRCFKWAVSHELIPPSVYQGLATVEGLRHGRTIAKESRVVTAVPMAHVEAVRPFVSRAVWGLIQVQLHSGARSGEILRLRRCDIDTSGEIWTAKISEHKTAVKGKSRVLYFGKRAQAVLRESFVGKGPADYLFDPRDAERERHAKAESHRRPNQKPNPKTTDRALGECYTADSYRRAVTRACKLADVPVWHPHRLRHAAAALAEKQFGLNAAAAFLGHADVSITRVYAALDAAQAVEVARAIG